MSSKYEEITSDKDGQLLVYGDLFQKLEDDDDVYQTIKELYGMIWFLAAGYGESPEETVKLVKRAKEQQKLGIGVSPGVHGFLPGSRA